MTLDLLDKKILHQLDRNSRVSYSKIAKKLKTSPQVVKYRVEQLYKNGILLYCWPMVEYRGIGYFFGLHFIKLKNLTPEKEKEFYGYLNSHKFIPIIMRGQGYADIIIGIDGQGIHHLNEIMQDLNTRFSDIFLDWDTVIPIGFSRFNRNYLVGTSESTEKVAFTGASVKKESDEKDRMVLSMLNNNARTPILEIVKKVGISYENVVKRIKKLENSGVIQCYTVLLDHVKAGYPRYRTLIKFAGLTKQEEKRFFTYCDFHPNIVHHLKVLGNWDLVVDIEVENMEKLRQIIEEIKFKFSKSIRRIEPTYIYKIDRFRDIPVEYPEFND
ncbi:MAG: winged helix-turn-helix transcriptional regulator [Candidatus Micrarchaeota archaeon]|nr:winged helix-turn-helix transcriptional regulator [Candidatus Micrarchaeota archaeon]